MLATKARSCAYVWLVYNAKGQISCKKSQIKAKQPEIKREKEQTDIPSLSTWNNTTSLPANCIVDNYVSIVLILYMSSCHFMSYVLVH